MAGRLGLRNEATIGNRSIENHASGILCCLLFRLCCEKKGHSNLAYGFSGDSADRLNADKLREVVEVLVPRVQCEIMLQSERCQPHVICRNRCTLFSKLPENRGIMMGRLFIGE